MNKINLIYFPRKKCLNNTLKENLTQNSFSISKPISDYAPKKLMKVKMAKHYPSK